MKKFLVKRIGYMIVTLVIIILYDAQYSGRSACPHGKKSS